MKHIYHIFLDIIYKYTSISNIKTLYQLVETRLIDFPYLNFKNVLKNYIIDFIFNRKIKMYPEYCVA